MRQQAQWMLLRRLVASLAAPIIVAAAPAIRMLEDDGPEVEPGSSAFWLQGVVIIVLVLLGGTFAGLTLGLMGLDMVNLKVLSEAGDEKERRQAAKVLKLLERGRHWVLVVLLLSNVVVNESLPIFLDNVLGGGVLAVVISTALIVVFGEIIPQAVCARYGLSIGSATVPFVLALMYLEWPIAYPIAKLLDHVLGEEQGNTYRKAELKTFVALHRQLGDDQLDEDTVTIISSVLELGEKSIESIMTPIDDVFTLSADQILNQELVDKIAEAGYSRIPVHAQDDPSNYLGMLLVKQLISYDPDDERPVNFFNLAPLPEAEGTMTCLEALNFFQQGRSHMLLISREPGEPRGAVGVVSLEDVIEELIDEEILDETDVFVDVKRKIRAVRRPPLGGRLGTTAGKGIGPLLRDAIVRRQGGKDERSPRPSFVESQRPDGGYGAMGTLSKEDVEHPENGPTARAVEKVKVKGGTPQRRAELVEAGRTIVRTASARQSPTPSGTNTPTRQQSMVAEQQQEDGERQPLLKPGDNAK